MQLGNKEKNEETTSPHNANREAILDPYGGDLKQKQATDSKEKGLEHKGWWEMSEKQREETLVELLEKGKTLKEIANILGVKYSTLHGWYNRNYRRYDFGVEFSDMEIDLLIQAIAFLLNKKNDEYRVYAEALRETQYHHEYFQSKQNSENEKHTVQTMKKTKTEDKNNELNILEIKKREAMLEVSTLKDLMIKIHKLKEIMTRTRDVIRITKLVEKNKVF